jgi:metallo-beta-lactamase class B
MKRLLVGALAVVMAIGLVRAQGNQNWNQKAPWGPNERQGNPLDNTREPFKIFDNVYYVGLHTVASYLITTSGGLVLLDATNAETGPSVVNNIRKAGFNPADVKYIFVTHSHLDHFGGVGAVKQAAPAARVGMSAEDWESAEKQQSNPNGRQNLGIKLTRDLVIKDNDTIRLGDDTFKFYFSPGHTVGATSVEYQVRDRGTSYRALSPGGLGMQFGPEWTPVYLESMQRLKRLGPWDVILGNHTFLMPRDLEKDIEPALATRANGPHPAVPGAAKINEWFDAVIKVVNEKLAAEQQQKKSSGN